MTEGSENQSDGFVSILSPLKNRKINFFESPSKLHN